MVEFEKCKVLGDGLGAAKHAEKGKVKAAGILEEPK